MNLYFKPKCNKNASPIPAVQIPLYKQLPCDDEPDSSNYNSSTQTNNNISQLVSIYKYHVVCDDNADPSYKQIPCDDELHFSNFNYSETNSSNFNSSETNSNNLQLISIHKYPVVCDDKKAESNNYTIGEVKGQNTGGALANNVNNSAGCSYGRSMLSCKLDAFDIGNHINCKRSASETSALLDKILFVYSDINKGAFCERCVLFGNQQSDRNGMRMRKLFVEPFVDCKHARKRFQQPENNSSILL